MGLGQRQGSRPARSPTSPDSYSFRRRFALALLACALVALGCGKQQPAVQQPPPIRDYIRQTWDVLTRSNRMLAAAAIDPKFQPGANGRWPVYVAHGEDLGRIESHLKQELPARDLAKIDLRPLPQDAAPLHEQGLLYLPLPYVVPGGRFNEMYGWDSYFIQVGLLRDNRLDLAKDMADNFLYEIHQYGKILNANRTYYMTRSQPPFLTAMLLVVYRQSGDRKWLEAALPAVEQCYRYWTSGPHLTPGTGLSRYYDLGEGPAPEVLASERDAQGQTHYDRVKEYYRTHEVRDYDLGQYYDAKRDQLTALFYKGDRSMRESGFDPSNRFGPFNVDIIHYNPVCLNSLLYLTETQTAEIMGILGRGAEQAAWQKRAQERAARINRLMWDEKEGLYYDYDFAHKRVRRYPFLTTFYPLWVGTATKEQAARVAGNLRLFERPGGLATSTNHSGNQWDAPFGWAPLEMISVEGLRRYGFNSEADRITEEFLSLVLQEYRMSGIIVEKYDVEQRSSRVSSGIKFGYGSNEAGFGWTNGVFLELLDALNPEQQRALLGR